MFGTNFAISVAKVNEKKRNLSTLLTETNKFMYNFCVVFVGAKEEVMT